MSNTKDYLSALQEEERRVPPNLPDVIEQIDQIQLYLNATLENERIVKGKIAKVDNVVKKLIENHIKIKKQAERIGAFLKDESALLRVHQDKYDDKTRKFCRNILKDLKSVLDINNRSLALSQHLINEIN